MGLIHDDPSGVLFFKMPAKKVRQSRKQPVPVQDLKKPFSKAKAKAAPVVAPEPPRKQLTSGFLSYLASAMRSKSEDVCEQAKFIHQRYAEMPADQKKMVADFFRMGGKKAGLQSTYSQSMALQTKAAGGEWSGYVNLHTLMDLWKASLGLE